MSSAVYIRRTVREIQNKLRNVKSKDDYLSCLRLICQYIPLKKSDSKNENLDKKPIDDENQEIFLKTHYIQMCKFLLDIISIENVGQLSHSEFSQYFLHIFLDGSCENAFLILMDTIAITSPGYKLNKCILLLEEFLKAHKVASILFEQSGLNKVTSCSMFEWKRQGRMLQWESMIVELASVPEKMANKLKTEVSEIFQQQHYIPLLISDILLTLGTACRHIRLSRDCSLEFVSHLIGKLCLCGYADQFWRLVLRQTMLLVRKDFIWSQVMETVVTRVPDRCMESVLVPLVKSLTWYGLVDRYLGNCVTQNQKVQLLLCTKLIFHRHYKSPQVLQNVIGYLATGPTRQYLYIKMLKELVQVWGDESAMRHTSYEQHVYLTQALVISIAFLTESLKHEHKDELLRYLLVSVQNHLGFSDGKVRRLGMLVGEIVTRRLEPDGPELRFEVEEDEEVKALKSLLDIPTDPFIDDLTDELCMMLSERGTEVALSGLEEMVSPSEKHVPTPPVTQPDPPSDLDSDDDLEPYDMSHDTDKVKVRQPKYIRDCMEDLIGNEGPERVEQALKAAEGLIRGKPYGVAEVSVEFTKVLVHLADEYSLPDFRTIRFSTLVALAVTAPEQVASYLSEQFYDKNYNIRQRLDIIEVLGTAAQELSRPTDPAAKGDNLPKPKVQELTASSTEPESWQDVVQRRIESKTRRFGQGRSKPEATPMENRFAPVAGHFFYPLMGNFDRPENTFDLMGEDCYVLGRLMYTLGIVMYAAANSPPARQMASALLEFIWVLRFHGDSKVRQGLLFAVSMIYLSVPPHVLLNDLQQEVFESKNWLEDVIDKDVNVQCKTLAVQALVLLENIIKQEFLSEPDFN
ncbi:telomere length regulation protein TEL2 homolog [Mya arenaria]|uniref:telomere length regulation protein TEL2 homolog n=1 Tax=Mya arenaria TaxID=6604 RepID=UPI0022E55518|nr:telomere length regulation protein TEL2 homolog [Mya arenaria]